MSDHLDEIVRQFRIANQLKIMEIGLMIPEDWPLEETKKALARLEGLSDVIGGGNLTCKE